MHTIEDTKGKTYQMPENWQETTPKQAEKIARCVVKNDQWGIVKILLPQVQSILNQIPPRQYDKALLANILGVSKDQDLGVDISNFTDRNLTQQRFLELSSFALSPEGFTTDMLESFKLDGVTYQGTGNYFELLTFDGYTHAETACFYYLKTGQKQFLQQLAASIYTENGEKFKADRLSQRIKAFKNLPEHFGWLAFQYFAGCKMAMLEEDKEAEFSVFSQPQSEGKEAKGSPKPQVPFDWSDTMLWLSESPQFPGLKAVNEAYFWEVKAHLERENRRVSKRKN